ncbi:dihydrodipicolinate synthase family protein [Chloroflexota bacterium]
MITFKGIVGAPVTPFTDDNLVDRGTFEKLVNFLIDSGIGVLGVPLHIGESLNMSLEERKELAEVAVASAAGRVPVIVNVSLPGTDSVIDLARHSQQIGAAGVISVTPYHWQPSEEALLAHYVALGSAIDIPFLAYNLPEKLGVSVTPQLVIQLIERLDNFAGIKDASHHMGHFTEFCRVALRLRPEFALFTGLEYLLPSMVVGGVGSFSACGAVAPQMTHDLYTACVSGEFERARGLQYKISHLLQIISPKYPATIKAAMEIMGRPVGRTRLPILGLVDEEKEQLRQDLEALGVLEEPHGWKVESTIRG